METLNRVGGQNDILVHFTRHNAMSFCPSWYFFLNVGLKRLKLQLTFKIVLYIYSLQLFDLAMSQNYSKNEFQAAK